MPLTLPDRMPVSIAALPVNRQGYPIPWFVYIDPDTSVADFRVVAPGRIRAAAGQARCWICGGHMPDWQLQAFVIGPMCAVNRVSAEPPSHTACAMWAARACPFLVNPNMVRRTSGLAAHGPVTSAGVMITRHPGVSAVWVVRRRDWSLFTDGDGGLLFDVGSPRRVWWLAHGRAATRAEVAASITSGMPALRDLSRDEPGGDAALDEQLAAAQLYLPAA